VLTFSLSLYTTSGNANGVNRCVRQTTAPFRKPPQAALQALEVELLRQDLGFGRAAYTDAISQSPEPP